MQLSGQEEEDEESTTAVDWNWKRNTYLYSIIPLLVHDDKAAMQPQHVLVVVSCGGRGGLVSYNSNEDAKLATKGLSQVTPFGIY